MKEQLAQSMFDYLIKLSGGKLLLSPEQLEQVVHISPKQQSAHRKANTFPIRYKTIGRLVFYAINDVIEYMLSGQTQVAEVKKEVVKEPIKITKSSKAIKDVSSIFMMKSFASVLEQESQQLLQLSNNLIKYSDSFSLYEKLNSKLISKNTTN